MYVCVYVTMHLGYYISPTKSTLIPTQSMIHLGFGIDSRDQSYSITDKYRAKFRACRSALLERGTACLTDIQSWFGKCSHLKLVFPATALFTIHCRQLMSVLDEERRPLPQEALEEIRFWSFVDTFTDPVPFLLHQHVSLSLYTDASGYAWGAQVNSPSGPAVFRDYWTTELLSHDICVKEALAVLFALQTIVDSLYRRRIDVYVDNEGLVLAWDGLKSRSLELTGVLQSLFLFSLDCRAHIKLIWVPTDKNPADAPSRELDRADSTLSFRLRRRLWECYGPFTFDLMALPSNVFTDPQGRPLPFFSRFPHPSAAGVNVFAQRPPSGQLLYVFPPFSMILALVGLLVEWGGVKVVIVLPLFPGKHPDWMASLRPFVQDELPLSAPGSSGVLRFPSKGGFGENLLPVPFGLSAFRCFFPPRSVPVASRLAAPRSVRVLVLADSMLRPLRAVSWPAPFLVAVHCFSGATFLQTLERGLHFSQHKCDILLFHAGVNDASRGGADFDSAFGASCRRALRAFPAHFAGAKLVLSTLCLTRSSDINIRVAAANKMLREVAREGGWFLVSNDNVHITDLSDTVHLNAAGTARVFSNFVNTLKFIA